MTFHVNKNEVERVLDVQLSSFWRGTYNKRLVSETLEEALERCFLSFQGVALNRVNDGNKVFFSISDTVEWAVFLYYLSNSLYKKRYLDEATVVYYLNKIMHSVEWFYAIDLPNHFFAEHPHNSVLGKAVYGDYFFCFHGTTVGANYKADGTPAYPCLGNNVFMCANSTILGESHIGNNVILSTNSYVKDMDIPDNCIVFGGGVESNVTIKKVSENEIKSRISGFWKN